MALIRAAVALLAGCILAMAAANVSAQNQLSKAHSVWELELGAHAVELPARAFTGLACGTNGGPPSRAVEGWLDYANCAAEPETGLHEISFRRDDELEYAAKARRISAPAVRLGSTTVFGVPVIASGLFDARGFLVGLRVVTDARGLDPETRTLNISLWNFVRGRFGGEDWQCNDLPVLEGEQPIGGQFLKRRCEKATNGGAQHIALEGHYYRKRGQFGVDPHTRLGTEGQFEVTVRTDVRLVGGVTDAEQRLAALGPIEPAPDPRIERLRECPGCELAGENLKWADLRGVNLAGANLSGANLHGAKLDRANLAGANLTGANLNRTIARRTNFEAADLSGAMLFEARLDGSNLKRANLQRALAGNIELIGTDLEGADVRLVDMRDSRLGRANFTDADLSGSHMHNSRMSLAILKDATMVRTVAIDALMTGVDLSGADLQQADLFGADLREANLAGANLIGARLARTNLIDANLEGAKRD